LKLLLLRRNQLAKRSPLPRRNPRRPKLRKSLSKKKCLPRPKARRRLLQRKSQTPVRDLTQGSHGLVRLKLTRRTSTVISILTPEDLTQEAMMMRRTIAEVPSEAIVATQEVLTEEPHVTTLVVLLKATPTMAAETKRSTTVLPQGTTEVLVNMRKSCPRDLASTLATDPSRWTAEVVDILHWRMRGQATKRDHLSKAGEVAVKKITAKAMSFEITPVSSCDCF
jgi:hypothetical protein